MSEIAKGAHSFALAESKPAISEHAQEHAQPFRAAVLDIVGGIFLNISQFLCSIGGN